MISRQNESLADARTSPDRLDHVTNKDIIDIFDDNFILSDSKSFNQDSSSHNENRLNFQPDASHPKNKLERDTKAYNSPKRHKENRHFPPNPLMVPQMNYMQTPYMQMPNQPYVNMMQPQGYVYPLNDSGYRRVNQYQNSNNYYQYDSYNNQQQGTFAVKNNVNNSNQKPKRGDDIQRKESKDNNTLQQNQQQSYKKEKKQDKLSSDGESLSGDQKNSVLDPEEFENLIKNAPKLAKDQTGCRMLQKEIETEDPVVVGRIFDNIIQDFGQLMIDPFGNYLCQKITEMCDNSQMKQIIQSVSNELPEICYNPHGTRAVQKLIEVIKEQELIEMLIESLSKDVVGLVKDNNGNHVIQKCLTSMSDRNKQFIYDSIVNNCIDIATHKHGCCVIQRCLDHASKKQKAELCKVVSENAYELVKDQYGNYVVQYVLELKDTDQKTRQRIADELSTDIVELSKQKFSSNVVEKCLQSGIGSIREHFLNLMMSDDTLIEVVCDKFANYVLQRFLANADEDERNGILQTVVNNYETIKNDPFGSKIYSKICKNYNLNDETGSIPNHSLSPLISENSKQSTTAKSDTNIRHTNNGGLKRQHHNRKDDKRGNFNNDGGNRSRRYSHSNQQNNMQKGGPYPRQNNMMPNQAMYAPMRNDMMQQGNYGPGMMQPGFFMAQPQMYNQYYNYPASQQGMYYPKIY